MLTFKQYVLENRPWSKTIAKNTKEFTIHLTAKIDPEATYYRFSLQTGKWYSSKIPFTVLGKDIVSYVKTKNKDYLGSIFPLDIYLHPAVLNGEELDGVIFGPLTVRQIPQKSYLFVNANKMDTNASDQEYFNIYNKLVPDEEKNINYSLQLIEDALKYIKHKQTIFDTYKKGGEDSGLDLSNLLEKNKN